MTESQNPTPTYTEDLEEGRDFITSMIREEDGGGTSRALTQAGITRFCDAVLKLGPITSPPPTMDSFLADHEDIAARIKNARGGFRSIMPLILAAHPEYCFRRADLSAICTALLSWHQAAAPETTIAKGGKIPVDVIQVVNKSGQWGLAHQSFTLEEHPKSVRFYGLRSPFTYLSSARELNTLHRLDPADREAGVAAAKAYHQETFLDVPADKWDQGHANPNDTGATIWQPGSYQRSRRDRFIFDEHGLPLAPTVSELTSNVNKYYSREEQKDLLAKLIKLHGSPSTSPKPNKAKQRPTPAAPSSQQQLF